MSSLTRRDDTASCLPPAWASSAQPWQQAVLPAFGHLVLGVALAVLLLGWAAEIKLNSQLGRPLTADQPAMPAGLFVLAAVLAGCAFGALEIVALRWPLAWWQRIVFSSLAGLFVALGLVVGTRLNPGWREASLVALLVYLVLLTIGGGWLAVGRARHQAPLRWRSLLRPAWPPLVVGVSLIVAGIVALILDGGRFPRPGSLLAEAAHRIIAFYPPQVTFSQLARLDNWDGQTALLAPPLSEIMIYTHIVPAARLTATAGFRPSLFLPDQAGVRFQIEWEAEDYRELLYDEILVQQNVSHFGERAPIDIDLEHLTNYGGRFIFRTIPVGFPPDRVVEAAWLNPRMLARSPHTRPEALVRDGLLSSTIGLLFVLWSRIHDEGTRSDRTPERTHQAA